MALVRAALRRVCLALFAAVLVGANVFGVPVAGAAGQIWSGNYFLLRYASGKTGTSLAARQPEPDFSDIYTFVTDCSRGACVATVVDGPRPDNPTLPLPPQYTWNGTTWVHIYEWQWDCYMGEGCRRRGIRPSRSRTTRRSLTEHCVAAGAPISTAGPAMAPSSWMSQRFPFADRSVVRARPSRRDYGQCAISAADFPTCAQSGRSVPPLGQRA